MDELKKTQSMAEKAFHDARYVYIDRKKTKQGDSFLAFWINIKVYAVSGVTARNAHSARKYIMRFLETDDLKKAISLAGDEAEKLLLFHLADAAFEYLRINHTDKGYRSKLFGFVAMKDIEVASKSATEIYYELIPLIYRMEDFKYKVALIKILDRAFKYTYKDFALNEKVLSDMDDGLVALIR